MYDSDLKVGDNMYLVSVACAPQHVVVNVTVAHSRPHCVSGHIASTAPMLGMVQKHRNYKNNVVKKKMEEERFSAITFLREKSIRGDLRISADGFPRMDFCLLQIFSVYSSSYYY